MAGGQPGSTTQSLRPQDFPDEWVKYLNGHSFPDEMQSELWDALGADVDAEGFSSQDSEVDDGGASGNDGKDGSEHEQEPQLTDRETGSRLGALHLDSDSDSDDEEEEEPMSRARAATDADIMEVDVPGERCAHWHAWIIYNIG